MLKRKSTLARFPLLLIIISAPKSRGYTILEGNITNLIKFVSIPSLFSTLCARFCTSISKQQIITFTSSMRALAICTLTISLFSLLVA